MRVIGGEIGWNGIPDLPMVFSTSGGGRSALSKQFTVQVGSFKLNY